LTRLGRLARDKRSRLLQKIVNYVCKRFYNISHLVDLLLLDEVTEMFEMEEE
jgi:hypothetical protein